MKKNKYILTALTIFFGLILSVNAKTNDITNLPSNTVDFNKKGSIEITLKLETEEIAIPGVELSVYKLADATEENYNLKFTYTEEYNDCQVSLDDLTDNTLTNDLLKCTENKSAKYSNITDNNGKVKYEDLDLGLYLIKQTNKVKGYSNIEPFLITIPNIENNSWIYDIKSLPKTEIYREIDLTVKKVWNSNNKNHPSQVTINLLKNNKVIDTVILNKNNNWTYTWENIEKSDKYSIKEINVPKGYTDSYKKEGNTYIVTNTDTLANTGQIYYPIIICVTLGMIFILLGFIESRKED